MDGVFSIPYSEYEVIIQLQEYFKKNDGFSIFIPTSRQEKAIDFILLNKRNSKVLRFQVKGSRSWMNTDPNKKKTTKYTLLFNNFVKRYSPYAADVYLLFGLYPIYDSSSNIRSKHKFWKSIILAFTDQEMKSFLTSIKKIKSPKEPDAFFYIGFNDISEIIVTRGIKARPNVTKYLLSKRVDDIKKVLY